MSTRRWIALAVFALVAVGVAYVATVERKPDIGRKGSEDLGEGQPIVVSRLPPSYAIEYRLEERLADSIRVSTEKLWVRRPFEARVETRKDGKLVSSIVWALGRNASRQGPAEPLVSDQPPEVAGADPRIEQTVDAAVHDDVVTRRERRRVAQRVCQVLRTRHRLVGADFDAPTKKDYVDSCVDRNGLVLEELQVIGGERQVRRLARRVSANPSLADETFAVGTPTVDVNHGGGNTRPVDPTSNPPGMFWQLDQPPAGFTLVNRYSVVPPQPENFSDPSREPYRRAEVSDVFRSGVDVIVVARGATLRGQNAWEPNPDNSTIDLGPLGRGEIVLTGRGIEVRALLTAGRYVRVYGTRPADELATIARQLHEVPGTDLKFLDE